MPTPATFARAGIACGLLAPVWWIICLFLPGLFFPGYAFTTDFISALGASDSPVAGFMIVAGFGLTGVLYAAFALSAGWQLRRDHWVWGAVVLLLLAAGARIATGVYPCDPGCTPVHESNTQETHRQFATAGYALMMAAAAGWAAMGARLSGLKPVMPWAIGGITWGAVCLVLMLVQPQWQGLFQRLAGIALNVWVLVLALCLWREHTTVVAPPPPPASRRRAR